MILKALADYYQRILDDPNTDIAPPGFERKPIDFLIVLNEDGAFENLRDIREGTGRSRMGRVSLVPKGVKRSSGIAANLLWDTVPYVLGKALPQKGKKLEDLEIRAVKQHAAFVEKIEQIFEGSDDCGIQAVLSFLKRSDYSPVFNHAVWSDVEESGGNVSFVLLNETRLICQRPAVVTMILEKSEPEGAVQTCAITGKEDVPAELHTSIKGVWGAQSSGANIVSFNLDAFRSFGKKQGHNARSVSPPSLPIPLHSTIYWPPRISGCRWGMPVRFFGRRIYAILSRISIPFLHRQKAKSRSAMIKSVACFQP